MDTLGLGKIITTEQFRDAIHISVAPVVASEKLMPGDDIGFVDGSAEAVYGEHPKPIGIVDPFLKGSVSKGQKFWMLLYPNTITSLRHEWTHPAFRPSVDSEDAKKEAKAWIAALAAKIGDPFDTFDDLMAHVASCIESGDWFTEQGSESMRTRWYDNEDQFWEYYEVLTGKKKPEEPPVVFSCSC